MRSCLCLVVWLAIGGPFARAEEPWRLFDGCRWAFPQLCDEWRQRRCWCPDDYCRKCLPAAPPCVKGCVDDYCRKTCPLFLGSLCAPWYTCGSAETSGGPCRPCPPRP